VDDELTPDEVAALANTFPPERARTLLGTAKFPRRAIPVVGFNDSQEFWELIAAKVALGVMPDGRREILAAARRQYLFNKEFADPGPSANPAAAAPAPAPAPTSPAASVIHVTGGQGIQIGHSNSQVNNHYQPPSARQPQPWTQAGAVRPDDGARLRVLVLGASPAGVAPVRADAEARRIEGAVAADRVDVRYVAAAVATDVEQVRDFRPHIVHFVCHGDEDRLVFSDSLGGYDAVQAGGVAATLAYYQQARKIRLRAIVLSACDGEKLAPAFSAVADTVIAHRGKLADPCGLAFAGQFYRLVSNAVAAAAAVPAGAARGSETRGSETRGSEARGSEARGSEFGDIDLADTATEAAVLTVALSSPCAPVRSNLIVLPSGG
jgi:hypothetical protein